VCYQVERGLFDELITRPEESYRLWCVVVCDLENLKNEEATTRVGLQRHNKKVVVLVVVVGVIVIISVLILAEAAVDLNSA
jgi:hypothetical protein